MCELKKSLEERLSEGGGQVELLAAVVNLSTFCLQWNIIGAANWQANMAGLEICQANMAGLLQPIGLNQSSQEGCQGNMTRGENQLDWDIFFRIVVIIVYTGQTWWTAQRAPIS